MNVIAKNKEDYISFSTRVVVDTYINLFGKEMEKKIKLRFIDSVKFMASSLEKLTNSLVGTSELRCDLCKEECVPECIDGQYVAHAKCKNCYSGGAKRQQNKNLTIDNLRLGHTDEQLRLLLAKGVYLYQYMSSWNKFKGTHLPPMEALS